MGIANLKKLIGECGVRRHLSAYKGKRIGIDISIWLYRFIYRDVPNAVLEGLLKQLTQCHRYGIIPVYVFDGTASSEIKIEVERRQQRREKVRNTLDTLGVELEETLETLGDPVAAASTAILVDEVNEELGNIASVTPSIPFEELDVPLFIGDSDDEEFIEPGTVEDFTLETPEDLMLKAVRIQSRIHSLQKQVRRPSKDMILQCKQVLELLGVPYRQSPGESDTTIAEMMARGEIDAVLSEDTDMLPYGCEWFITGFKDGSDFVTEFQLSRILDHLKLTREQFVDVCILCGCDYADKIYKIAVKGAYDMIKRHKNIEGVLAHIQSKPQLTERHPYPEDFVEQVTRARNMFLRRNADGLPGVVLSEDVLENARWDFDVASANADAYLAFLQQQFGGAGSMLEPGYLKLCQSNVKPVVPPNQRTMMDYFGSNVGIKKN